MKNKIVMFALMCALLVGVFPLHHAEKAYAAMEDDAFVNACFALKDNEEIYNLIMDYPYVIGKTSGYGCDYMLMVYNEEGENACVKVGGQYAYSKYTLAGFKTGGVKSFGFCYLYNDGEWVLNGHSNAGFDGDRYSYPEILASSFSVIYNKDGGVLYEDVKTLLDYTDGYNFGAWCKDAGLNCSSSTNESNTVLPYVYNDYVHIVRRTGLDKYGRWVLTTIGNSIIGDNLSDYTLMVDDNGELQVYALYSGEEEQGYQLFVRNYIYDTDGWKLISFELFDTREDDDFIIELGEDSAINDVNLLAYTSVDIYDDGLSLLHPASTEFYDVNDVLPDVPEQPEGPEEPSVTPTVPPSGGSGGTGLTLYRPEMSGKIVSSFASMFDVPNGADEDVVLDLLQGMNVTVHGWLSDASGKVWYYCTYKNVYEDKVSLFTGYMDSANVGLTNGADVEDGEDMTLRDKIMEITAFVGSVPLIIGALFSFLPPWCLTLTGIGFAIIAIIMIRRGTLG